jgi:penicillin-binding protein 1C
MMNQSGISHSAGYYGLSLILGGAESSLWDITKDYAGMASILNFYNKTGKYRRHEFVKPVYRKGVTPDFGKTISKAPLFDAGSIYLTLNIIKNLNRPEGDKNWELFKSSQPIAWKTGTSFGLKDAWAVGVTPKYAIGVWVGNADGKGRPGLVGVQVAAPVLFDVLSVLPPSGWFDVPYNNLVKARVCKISGYLAGPYCDKTEEEWIPKNGVKTKICPFHHKVFLDKAGEHRVNSSCYPLAKMKQRDMFSLPPVEGYYYARLHPNYQPLPSFRKGCQRENEQRLRFIYPAKNQTVVLPKNFNEKVNDVVFKVADPSPDATLYWYLNARFIGKTQTFHEISVSPRPGTYTLTVEDQQGHEIQQRVVVKRAS